jgi:hypothetical protein
VGQISTRGRGQCPGAAGGFGEGKRGDHSRHIDGQGDAGRLREVLLRVLTLLRTPVRQAFPVSEGRGSTWRVHLQRHGARRRPMRGGGADFVSGTE